MVNKAQAKKYCKEDISKIENYEQAIIHKAVTLFGRCAYNADDQLTLDNLDYISLTKA